MHRNRADLLPVVCLVLVGVVLPPGNAAPPGNLLRNPGFEQDLSAWEESGSGGRYNIASEGRTGCALRYLNTAEAGATDNPHMDQIVRVEPDVPYEAAVWCRSDGILRPVLRVADAEWRTLALAQAPPDTTWHLIRTVFRAPPGTEFVRFQLFGGALDDFRAGAKGTVLFDQAVLKRWDIQSPPPAPLATIVLDTGRTGPRVHPTFFGVNILFCFDDDQALRNPQLADALRALPCRFLRFPGGEMADNYHWQSHTLDNPKKWPFRQGPDTTDTDEFLAFRVAVGSEANIVLNLESWVARNAVAQGVREAAAWVRYCNIRHRAGIRLWEVGNETYLKGGYHPMTAAEYARAFTAYAEALHGVDPNVLVGAVGPDSPDAAGGMDAAAGNASPWWPTLFRSAGRSIGALVVHHYARVSDSPHERPWTEFTGFRHRIQALREAARKALERDVPIALTEWNVYGRNLRAVQHALLVAEFAQECLRLGIEYANFWPLRIQPKSKRWGRLSLLGFDSMEPRPVYDVLHRYAETAGGRIVATSSWGTRGITAFGVLDSGAGDSQLTVFLVNRLAIVPALPVHVSVSGGAPSWTLVSAETLAAGSEGRKFEQRTPAIRQPPRADTPWRIDLPAESLTILKLRARN